MAGFDNETMYAINADFSGNATPAEANGLFTNGQLWIGRTAVNAGGTHIDVATLTAGAGITITNGPGSITISAGGGSMPVDSFAMQTGTSPVVPDGSGLVTFNGASVAAGTNPVRTNGTAANTMQLEVQIASAVAAADATRNGLAHFDSDIFTISATGFVSTTAGSLVQTITGGPGITITGTASDPIVNSVVFTDTTALTMAVDNGYFATAAGTYNLPATAAQGELIHIVADTAGAVVVDAPALNFIRIGSAISAAGGTATSTAIGDSLTLRYRLSTLTWHATSVVGNWILT